MKMSEEKSGGVFVPRGLKDDDLEIFAYLLKGYVYADQVRPLTESEQRTVVAEMGNRRL